MVEIGRYNRLQIKRKTSIGLRLGNLEDDDILLPAKYVPDSYEIGGEMEVFCYLDNEERPVATTLHPYLVRGEFACLRVAQVNEIGAFLDWGIEKHLLVPFREQQQRMVEGEWYVVHCYLDKKTDRLVGSSRLKKFLDNSEIRLRQTEEVQLLVSRQTELGWEVIVNNAHLGLVYNSDIYGDINVGDTLVGYVKKIRQDHKLDISLQPIGFEKLGPSANKIFRLLNERGGVLKLHDRSDPADVKRELQMSKKTFKKAIGLLYKARKIRIGQDGIYQRKDQTEKER